MKDSAEDLKSRIEKFAKLLCEARYTVVFTGAGISTESGLPDYRGPDGVWTRRDKGLPPKLTDVPWDKVDPNKSHMAIVHLQQLSKMQFLITQNIDNLHLKSGIHPETIAELHGNMAMLRCKQCGATVDKSSGKTSCACGGFLISSIVDFGMQLPERDLHLAIEHSRMSDLFIVVGSSLVVTPAANMPREALYAGAKLVIINQGETPYDRIVHLRFHERIGDVLPIVVTRLKELMDHSD